MNCFITYLSRPAILFAAQPVSVNKVFTASVLYSLQFSHNLYNCFSIFRNIPHRNWHSQQNQKSEMTQQTFTLSYPFPLLTFPADGYIIAKVNLFHLFNKKKQTKKC